MGAFAGAFAVAVALAVAVAVAFAVAVAGAFAGAFAVAVAGAFAVAFAGAGAVAVAVAVAVAFAVAQEWLGKRSGRPTLFLFLYACLGLIAALTAVAQGVPRVDRIDEYSSIILFVAVLPLMNALADFASTGLTRFCLRRGLEARTLLWSMADLVGGALIFIALVVSMMAVAAWVHWLGGKPLLDLSALLTEIRADPGAYWWLYLTFLSTLLPTLLHLGIALFAVVFTAPRFVHGYIVDGLTEGGKGDDPKGRWAVRVLCLTMTLAIMAPVAAFGWAIQSHGWVGGHVLDGFEWIARGTGMI